MSDFRTTYSSIFICLLLNLVWMNKSLCNEIALRSHYTQLECVYDLVTGGKICDCQFRNMEFVLPAFDGNVNSITIRNCKKLLVTKGTFQEIGYVDRINIENIRNLVLESYLLDFARSLPVPKIKLTFSNVKLNEIVSFAISGSIDYIKFIECDIGEIFAYAINCLYTAVYNISFEHTQIGRIESQAMKRMSIDNFVMRNTTIREPLSSRAFFDLTIVNTFAMSNCTFSTIGSSAIWLSDVHYFSFADNKVGKIEGEALKMIVNGRISFERNNFSVFNYLAFKEIQVNSKYKLQNNRPMDFLFQSNTIQSTNFPIHIVTSSEFRMKIVDLRFSTPTECENASKLEHNQFLREFGDTVYFKIGKPNDSSAPYYIGITLATILSKTCHTSSTTMMIAIISTVSVILLLLIVGATSIFYRYWTRRQRKRELDIIRPDGKTYRETQIVVQVEHAGLLKTDL